MTLSIRLTMKILSMVASLMEPDGGNGEMDRTQGLFWCHCGHCSVKPLQAECICCVDWELWRWKPDNWYDDAVGQEEQAV